MNKYQEALEILCTYADGNPSSSGEFVGKMLQEANDTLQELVEKATQKAPSLYQDYDIDKHFEITKEKECLEKALDKACDRLDFFDHLYGDDEYEDWKTKEQWKEWCLKDVE